MAALLTGHSGGELGRVGAVLGAARFTGLNVGTLRPLTAQ
jgi:hypothetical protein